MTPENFTYWLQGFFELSNSVVLSEQQIRMIKDHLQLVFKKETPVVCHTIPTVWTYPEQLDCSETTSVYCANKSPAEKPSEIFCTDANANKEPMTGVGYFNIPVDRVNADANVFLNNSFVCGT